MTRKIRQSAFLFAGTAIGAGMLALPIATGGSGLLPAVIYMTLWSAYSLGTLLLLLECMGYEKKELAPGFISLSHLFSGHVGRGLIQGSFALLLYAVTAAYMIGGGQLCHKILSSLGGSLSLEMLCFLFSAFFALFASFSLHYVGWINQILMYGLIGSFAIMATLIAPQLDWASMSHVAPLKYLIPSTTVVVLSFACHNLLPSIVDYLDGDFRAIRRSIFIGMLLPWLIYLLWNVVIIGGLPTAGPGSVLDIQHHHASHGGELAMLAESLTHSLQHSFFSLDFLFVVFGLCAIITSYLGVSVSLKDFLIQKARLEHHAYAQSLGMACAYVPALWLALALPHGFSRVLGYAGLMVTYLFGLSPVIWTLKARYRGWQSRYPSGLSLPVVCLLGLMSIMVFSLELLPHVSAPQHETQQPLSD